MATIKKTYSRLVYVLVTDKLFYQFESLYDLRMYCKEEVPNLTNFTVFPIELLYNSTVYKKFRKGESQTFDTVSTFLKSPLYGKV